MSYDNKLELVIEVDAAGGNAEIKQTNANLNSLERTAVSSGKGAAAGMNQFERGTAQAREQMNQARQAAQMLASRIGVSLPEGATKWIASLKGVAPALSAAFGASAVVAIGFALFEAGKKLYDWIDGSKEAAEAAKKNREEIEKLTASYDEYADKIDALKRKWALAPLEGTKRGGQELSFIRSDLAIAKAEYEAVSAQFNRLYMDASRRDRFGQFTAQAIKAQAEFAKSFEDKTSITNRELAARQKYDSAKIELDTKILELNKEISAEAKKQTEEYLKQIDERVRLIEATKELRDANVKAMQDFRSQAQSEWQKSTGLPGPVGLPSVGEMIKGGLERQQQTARDIIASAKTVADLQQDNAQLQAQIAKQAGDPWAVTRLEIARLDERTKAYGISAKEIAAIEERKKLLIMGTNREIADDARNQFEKSAQSIEGFFNRVFLTARSFADVWKQLWTQAIGYVVSQFARMAAGWIATQRQMASGAGGSGFGGGATATNLASMGMAALGSYGGGSGASAAGSGPGGSGGILGGLLGGGFNLAGLKNFIGMGDASGAHLQDIVAGKSTFSLSGLAKSNAALMGGGLLAMYGLKRGGLSGLVMTTAGGAMIGYKYGGALGAGIGAGIGAVAGLVRLFFKGAEEKAREKIKATYGVDMKEKNILRQIVDMAKQGFGGNLDMAIRSQEIRDLIELYAMSTGQGTRGMPAKMTAGNFVQRGGSLYNMGGSGGGGLLPGAGLGLSKASGAPTIVNITIPGAKDFFEKETVQVVVNNPRAVQSASTAATRSNYNRREQTALQLSPGTLTS